MLYASMNFYQQNIIMPRSVIWWKLCVFNKLIVLFSSVHRDTRQMKEKEKAKMQRLNNRLVTYIDKVHDLEMANKILAAENARLRKVKKEPEQDVAAIFDEELKVRRNSDIPLHKSWVMKYLVIEKLSIYWNCVPNDILFISSLFYRDWEPRTRKSMSWTWDFKSKETMPCMMWKKSKSSTLHPYFILLYTISLQKSISFFICISQHQILYFTSFTFKIVFHKIWLINNFEIWQLLKRKKVRSTNIQSNRGCSVTARPSKPFLTCQIRHTQLSHHTS